MTFKVGDKLQCFIDVPGCCAGVSDVVTVSWISDGKPVLGSPCDSWRHAGCNLFHHQGINHFRLTPAQPQSILIDGVETFLATAEELAKDWEGKLIQFWEEWLVIEGADVDSKWARFRFSHVKKFDYRPAKLVPYRLAKPAKTLEDVIEEVIYGDLAHPRDVAEDTANAIREHFDVTPKEA